MKKFIFSIIILVFLFGCDSSIPQPENGESFVNLGSNVFYINGVHSDFVTGIKKIKNDYPELMIISIASKNTGGYGSTVGYYVICEPR